MPVSYSQGTLVKVFKFLLLVSLVSIWSLHNALAMSDIFGQSVDELREDIERKHPVNYLLLAIQLFDEDEKDEAVKWYYIGQIRLKAHLKANPDLAPSEEPALYGSLKYLIGPLINEHASSDQDNWILLIDSALEWHSENPNYFTPKGKHKEIYEKIRNEFKAFRDEVESSKGEIKSFN